MTIYPEDIDPEFFLDEEDTESQEDSDKDLIPPGLEEEPGPGL